MAKSTPSSIGLSNYNEAYYFQSFASFCKTYSLSIPTNYYNFYYRNITG